MKRAVCNELFGTLDFPRTCELMASHGFDGIEIAPFTLFGEDGRLAPATIKMIRRNLADNGLEFAGFHWLFARPAGLFMVSGDTAVRTRAWNQLRHLLEAAGELGGGPLTFGSPKQRDSGQLPRAVARGYLKEGLQKLCKLAGSCNSSVLIEALQSADTNMINTLAEAEAFIDEVGCPAVAGMFDFHNCGDETLSWNQLIQRYKGIIRHVHLNTLDGGYPLHPDPAYLAAFRALKNNGYDAWVSLEIFTEPADPSVVLAATAGFLDEVDEALAAG
ncbi:MAG: sugar phosphate isomerase/epimerase family protein [Clostridia bacterium]|jgi:sugar phosphate isomerase/epimerase